MGETLGSRRMCAFFCQPPFIAKILLLLLIIIITMIIIILTIRIQISSPYITPSSWAFPCYNAAGW